MSTYYANDKYSAVLTSGYTVGQTTLYVSAVPNHVPTIIVAAKGTDNETVFAVTDKTSNSLTGVSRLRGANVDLDAQTPLTCLNNEEFTNQSATINAIFYEEHDETGKHATDQINEKTEDAGVTVDGVLLKDSFVSATQPSCSIYVSSSFTTTNGSEYIVGFNAERWDTHGFHDNTTNNSRITIPTGLSGRYLMICYINWAGSATGGRRVYIRKDGSGQLPETFDFVENGNAGALGVDIKNNSLIVSLVAGSYYELSITQWSGGDLTCYGVTWQIYKLP